MKFVFPGVKVLKFFIDEVLLFKAGRTAKLLLEKNLENKAKEVGSIRSSEIPDIFTNKDSIQDVKKLERAFKDRDKLYLTKNSANWTWWSVYLTIIKTFGRFYVLYFLFLIVNVIISYYVKLRAKEFLNSFISNNNFYPGLSDIIRGLLLLFFQMFNVIFTTHCEYYGAWLHYKVQSAISGSSLLRFLECKRIKNKDGLCILDNFDSTELLSLYQNIILVDADFTEFAISNSINVIAHPLHVLTSAIIASSVFEGLSLKICLLVLFTCFIFTIITQYLSSIYKKPFLKAREERIAEITKLLEHSRYLPVTHQLLPSINKLIHGKRTKELYYNSFRKYICMISEVFDRWMILSFTLTIGIYILYNKLSSSQASLMIIQGAWLIPTFYHPLNEVVFFTYYIIEGTISMERIANFLYSTRSDLKDSDDEPNCNQIIKKDGSSFNSNDEIAKVTLNNISFTCGKDVTPCVKDLSFELKPGIPCFVLGQICSGKTALLQGIGGHLFNENSVNNRNNILDGYFSLEFNSGKLINLLDISSHMCISYVPQIPWIPSGITLADIILCGSDYIEELWIKVLHQCDLEVDFCNWNIRSFDQAKERIFTDKQFSAGQKVRLSLARAIYSNLSNKDGKPQLLLVDCVLNSLDPFVCEEIIKKLFSRNGLLCNSMSIFVIEPPILEFVKQASSSNGFSYKIIKMSRKMILGTEDINLNNNFDSSKVCENIVKSDEYLNDTREPKITSNERNITKSKINVIEDEFTRSPANFFYLFFAGSKKKYKDFLEISDEKETDLRKGDIKRSNFETILLIILLAIPPILCKISESFLLMVLKDEHNLGISWNNFNSGLDINDNSMLKINNLGIYKSLLYIIPLKLGQNILSFWCTIYNVTFVISMISMCAITLLEIRIGLRAAKYFHNSLLLGYLGATSNSLLRWFPISFILNRLSNDQLYIDYCITRRTRFVIIALNSVLISIIPSIFASSNTLITLLTLISIGSYLYYNYMRYFVNGCRTLRSCYVSEYSPLVETIQTIGKGKKCLNTKKIRRFFFETSIEHINSVLRPQFAQVSLDAWFKMRIKLWLTIPITLMNIILPFISRNSNSSTRSIIALAIATTTGLIPLLSSLVSYWAKLETELVSVERSRLYLALARQAGLEYLRMKNLENNHSISNNGKDEVFIELENIEAKHSRLDSIDKNSNFDNSCLVGSNAIDTTCLHNISARVTVGEIVGIIGRTGSGKTTLLDVLAKILPNTSGKITSPKPDLEDYNLQEKLVKLNFPVEEFDFTILKTILESQRNLSHIALLPLEIYYSRESNVRDIIDPFGDYNYEEIRAALNICGFGSYIDAIEEERFKEKNQHISYDELETNPLTSSYQNNKAISIFLDQKLEALKLSILQLRMLLFVNFFLKRNKIKILLVDEPPVVLKSDSCNQERRSQLDSKKESGCILSSVINEYFRHCITFIVSHDIRSLQHVNRIFILGGGKLIKDIYYNQVFTNSELFDLVKTNSEN